MRSPTPTRTDETPRERTRRLRANAPQTARERHAYLLQLLERRAQHRERKLRALGRELATVTLKLREGKTTPRARTSHGEKTTPVRSRRGGSRNATRGSPDDPDDPDPSGSEAPPAGGETEELVCAADNCERRFVPHSPRQRFCSKRCADRARQSRKRAGKARSSDGYLEPGDDSTAQLCNCGGFALADPDGDLVCVACGRSAAGTKSRVNGFDNLVRLMEADSDGLYPRDPRRGRSGGGGGPQRRARTAESIVSWRKTQEGVPS